MKKKFLVIFAGLFILVLLIVNLFIVDIDEIDVGTARYLYEEKNISSEISEEDMEVIREIFDGKIVNVIDQPSCGFDENIAIIIGNETLCIACDECGIVYHKERKGYIRLDKKENEKIRDILGKYGFEWPCV